jgi:hypothetical protein
MGVGGSILQWHPELNIGFSYVPTDLLFHDLINYKGSLIQKMVVDIVRAKQKDQQKIKTKLTQFHKL